MWWGCPQFNTNTITMNRFLLFLFLVSPIVSAQTILLDDPFATGTTNGMSGVGNVAWFADAPNDCGGDGATFEAIGGTFVISNAEGSACCECETGGPALCGDNNTSLTVGPINGQGYYIQLSPGWINHNASGPMEPSANIPCANFNCGDITPGCGDPTGLPGMNSGGQDQMSISVNGIPYTSYCGNNIACPEPTLGFFNEDLNIEVIGGTQSSNEEYEISKVIFILAVLRFALETT